MKIKQKVFSYGLCLAFASFTTTQLHAAGLESNLTSTSALANSYAGSATGAHDISDGLFNPAVLSEFNKRSSIVASASYLSLDIDADNTSGNKPSGAGAVTGDRPGDGGTDSVVPAFYFATPIDKKTTFGFSVTSPYGLATEYDKNWIGRYQAIKSDLKTVNFNPSVAYQLNNKLSLGAGVQVQYIKAVLTNAAYISGADDAYVKTKGDDWGYGYTLGVNYKPTKNLKVGLGYRSKIDHKLEGTFRVSHSNPLVDSSSDFTSNLSTPETITFGAAYKINNNHELLADVSWARWSRINTLDVYASDTSSFASTPYEWRDSVKYALGYNNQFSDNLVVRYGTAYEKDAVADGNRNPRVPTGNRIWASFGLGYKLGKNTTIDATYLRQFHRRTQTDIATSPNPAATGGTPGLTTEYKTRVDVISVGLKQEF